MSYEIGMAILNLQPTERVGRTEYCDHDQLIRQVTGLDPKAESPQQRERVFQKFYEWADFDFLWCNSDGPAEWKDLGRVTDMGHAVYMADGEDFRTTVTCPFESTEQVLSFDAADEYGLPDVAERAAFFQRVTDRMRSLHPTAVIPGGYYKTLISGCIEAFGWDMFLTAVGEDADRFGQYVLEGIYRLSLANYRAWADTDINAFICHDDMVWTEGAIFKPDWYRRYVFPRYRKLWQPLKEKGIKVLFCSDGDFTEFIDDLAQAGADGFIFEPLTSLERIVEKYGRSHVIIGNADCRVLTFGDKEDIEREVKRCMDVAKACPGFIMAVGNHIPANVPIDNALYYFDLVNEYGRR